MAMPSLPCVVPTGGGHVGRRIAARWCCVPVLLMQACATFASDHHWFVAEHMLA